MKQLNFSYTYNVDKLPGRWWSEKLNAANYFFKPKLTDIDFAAKYITPMYLKGEDPFITIYEDE